MVVAIVACCSAAARPRIQDWACSLALTILLAVPLAILEFLSIQFDVYNSMHESAGWLAGAVLLFLALRRYEAALLARSVDLGKLLYDKITESSPPESS
mmetsp:Transcript_36288/g.79324  ORF Transcript_36288/g.79324 Transcript_36288/m.79324 type:complete len:99 (+) Transcript_36288:3-299(+)